MVMNNVDKLIKILERLNSGEESEHVKKEAGRILKSISPKELSLAEQKLTESGLSSDDMRALCDVHIKILSSKLTKSKDLKKGHVIHTMTAEHEKILEFLGQLEKSNKNIQKMWRYEKGNGEFKNLSQISKYLNEAESHHRREEDVLFPELEKRGVTCPPQVMRYEHEELRKNKKELIKLAKNAESMNFNEFKKSLNSTSRFIVSSLRDHIFKENNILYPTALDVIKENKVWNKMKTECDKIGYCSFTKL
ncbi:MAG: DUF438 domain-containing protein [Candidatus Aenigmarchaeota archaeon]|nr:DUF438 domain-containing protein [Candidatus Aenigmarchaeota archaeon]